MKLILSSLLAVSLLAPSAHADNKEFFYKRYLQRSMEADGLIDPVVFDTTSEGTIDQKINPSDATDARTFKQRYFVNSNYASGASAPVLYYICGEATCSAGELGGATLETAKKLGAHMVALEHRYYGTSQPFEKLSADNLKYLTTANALEDLASFQRYAQANLGLKGKWITIGGSYAGSLSAFYRLKHPELAAGALSSSGPVLAHGNFEEYDLQVATAAGPQCAAVMRDVMKKVEATFSDAGKLASMKALFDAQDVVENVDFIYVLADMAAIAVQYGYKDSFCKELTTAQDPVAGFASAGKRMFSLFGVTPVEDSFQGAVSENPNDYLGTFGMRAWLYQSCTEYGYWQIAFHDPAVSVRSALISREYHDQVCDRLFGIKKPVDDVATNREYYDHLLDPAQASKIFFTNGSNDPWAKLGINPALGNDKNASTPAYLIDGAAHCGDLGSTRTNDNASMTGARTKFRALATEWLK